MKIIVLIFFIGVISTVRHSANTINPNLLKSLKQEYESEMKTNDINVARLKKSIKNILKKTSPSDKSSFTSSSTGTKYKKETYSQINQNLLTLKEKYPHLIKLSTAQKLFNLPYPSQCKENKDGACESFIVKLTNFKKGDNDKPRVLLS